MNNNDTQTPIGYMPMPAGFRDRSIYLKGRPQHQKYDDFWRRHPPMDITHRAKIFAPFDALAGFGDCIAAKKVEYSARPELCEGEKEELDRKLSLLHRLTRSGREAGQNRPQVTVRYFSPCTDENSSAYGTGGTCKSLTGICHRVDVVSKTITIDETVLPIDDVTAVTGDLFES